MTVNQISTSRLVIVHLKFNIYNNIYYINELLGVVHILILQRDLLLLFLIITKN